MSSIVLHPKLGVNPRLTFCPKCGGDSNSLVMLGIKNYVDTCPQCDAKLYGGADRMHDGDLSNNWRCGRCGHRDSSSAFSSNRRELGEHEKVPGDLCKNCKEFYSTLHKAAHENNGCGVVCERCGSRFVVHGGSPFVKKMRDDNAMPIGKPFIVGVPQCENCADKKEGDADAVGETPQTDEAKGIAENAQGSAG